MSMIDSYQLWLMGALVLSSLLNGCYYLPIAIRAFFGEEASAAAQQRQSLERSTGELLPTFVLASLVIILAVFGGPINDYLQTGIEALWQ
jgi:NADH:ubiquinone oxidoreductase subunit 2 (subunit N)